MTEEKDLKTSEKEQEVFKEKEPTVKVKFNKQEMELPLKEAGELAQKGLKYNLIEKDYLKVKELAQKNGLTVDKFLNLLQNERYEKRFNELLEQTGGNKELTEKYLELEGENKADDNGFSELRAEFPEINEIGELPQEVKEKCELKGSNLLDEYLRYLLKQSKSKKESNENALKAKAASVGTLHNQSDTLNTAANEFLKGLWNR